MLLNNRTIALFIFTLLIITSFYYRSAKLNQFERSLHEHVLVLREPLWNFEVTTIEGYLDAIGKKYDYQYIKLTGDDETIYFEKKNPPTSAIEIFLLKAKLIFLVEKELDIYHNEDKIGTLIITARDTSIYFIASGLFVGVLLFIISSLSIRVFLAKRSVEEKLTVIQSQVIELRVQKEYIEEIFNVVPEGLIALDNRGKKIDSNRSLETIVSNWSSHLDIPGSEFERKLLEKLIEALQQGSSGEYSLQMGNATVHIEYSSSAHQRSSSDIASVVSLRDVTSITAMKRQLAQSQKLEAVGRLASGIAHEINTPTQYVLANTDFLAESYEDVDTIMSALSDYLDNASTETKASLSELIEEIDWPYLQEEIPKALKQSGEGLRRITSIVKAMKHFSHPSGDSFEVNDINSAVDNTVIVARNEWKYCSEVNLVLTENLPPIPCYLDKLNQVFLSMIVNGAHAIEEKYGKDSQHKGVITVETSFDDSFITVSISDDGCGMSKTVADKVFDPFFTTKSVNKGTGQGLAIAHDVVVNQHEGQISVESTEGAGTTFIIKLPREQSL